MQQRGAVVGCWVLRAVCQGPNAVGRSGISPLMRTLHDSGERSHTRTASVRTIPMAIQDLDVPGPMKSSGPSHLDPRTIRLLCVRASGDVPDADRLDLPNPRSLGRYPLRLAPGPYETERRQSSAVLVSRPYRPGICFPDGALNYRFDDNEPKAPDRYGSGAFAWLTGSMAQLDQSISSRACSAREAPIAVTTFFSSSGGGSTAGIPNDSIHSSRAQPIVW